MDPKSKKKRTRLLLDARTELTDDELKVSPVTRNYPKVISMTHQVARARYLVHQKNLRRDVLIKRAEKYGNKLIEEYVWAAPKGSK